MVNTILILLLPIWMAGSAFAAESNAVAERTVEVDDRDPLGRDTPRGAMIGYLAAMDAGDTELAARYLDLRNLPKNMQQYTPEQLAAGLAVVLQRSLWIDVERLSDDVHGMDADGLPSYRDEMGEVELNGGTTRLLLQRVPDDGDRFVWKVSNATIAILDDLYQEYRYNPLVEWLFENVPEVSFLGLELFKWVAALLTPLAATPVVLLVAWWFARMLVKPSLPMHDQMRRFLMGPVTVLCLIAIASIVMVQLGLGAEARKVSGAHTLTTVTGIWVLWSGINLGRDGYGQFLIKQGRGTSVALLRPFASALKIVFILFGLLMWLDNVGYQITALLTGLGVGGIAVALVLQKPLEDVFGAITLYTQQPIKVGDFGRFGTWTGTVEEISLRTTRIRTLDNTVLAVPNMKLASEPIENFSARQKILYAPVVRLRNDTSTGQIEKVLAGMRILLAEDELVLQEGARVRFSDIGAEAFQLKVFAYINVTDFPSYLAAAESLNLGVLRVIEGCGVKLAIPIVDSLTGS